jgi:hypothetical protein
MIDQVYLCTVSPFNGLRHPEKLLRIRERNTASRLAYLPFS